MSAYQTKFGTVFYDSTGNDHRPNIVDSNPSNHQRHEAVKLQKPALLAFRAAEVALGKRNAKDHGWNPLRAKGKGILLTGSWRSFSEQLSLWRSDSHRYASPYTSGHVQGLAIDVSTQFDDFNEVRPILLSLGWHQARPDDEPWHYTFAVSV